MQGKWGLIFFFYFIINNQGNVKSGEGNGLVANRSGFYISVYHLFVLYGILGNYLSPLGLSFFIFIGGFVMR